MQCPRCQEPQPANVKFCTHCGTALPQAQAPAPVATPAQPVVRRVVRVSPPPVTQAPPPVTQAPPAWRPPVIPAGRAPGGRPLHVWLVAAAVIALVAAFLPWYTTQSLSRITWTETGYDYGSAGRSTWHVPVLSSSFYGGGNGVNVLSLALIATFAGLGLRYRSGSWPRWARYTLLGAVGLTLFVGLVNTAADPHLGPLLFAVAGGVAAIPALQVLRQPR